MNNNVNQIVAAIVVLGCSAAAQAQSTGSMTPDPYGSSASWWMGGSPYSTTPWDNRSPYVTGSINGMDPDQKFNSGHGEGLGLRVGKAVSDHWDVQFGTTYDRDNAHDIKYSQSTLGADALYMFSRDRFKPFLEAGLGAEFDRTSNAATGVESRTSPYVDVGLGFQYQISDQWATQVDYRRSHAWLRSSAFDFDKVNDGILSVGVSYYFGKPRMAPPPLAAVAPPPPPPPPQIPPPPPPAKFQRYTLSATELFAFDSADLRMPQTKLDEVADALRGDPTVTTVQITGYTDRIGPDGYNLKLSERRAQAVKTYLVSKGIDAGRLVAVGKGKADPVVQCKEQKRADLIKCLEPNRRVVIEQITIERRVQ